MKTTTEATVTTWRPKPGETVYLVSENSMTREWSISRQIIETTRRPLWECEPQPSADTLVTFEGGNGCRWQTKNVYPTAEAATHGLAAKSLGWDAQEDAVHRHAMYEITSRRHEAMRKFDKEEQSERERHDVRKIAIARDIAYARLMRP